MTRQKAVLFVIAIFAASPFVASLRAQPPPARPAESVEIPLNPLPFVLKGLLRRPEGNGPFPAVVLLPACDHFVGSVDLTWGQALSSWGYVALTLDVFTSRGIVGKKTCLDPPPVGIAEDAYRGLNLLAARKDVDPKHVFIAGFGRGSSLVFAAVERGSVERAESRKFHGAVAFYPPRCGYIKGNTTVSTLVVVGARDQQLDACRRLAEGKDDDGISRQRGAGAPIRLAIIADAYAGFDQPDFREPVDTHGYHVEYSQSAVDQAKEALRQFLQSMIGRQQ